MMCNFKEFIKDEVAVEISDVFIVFAGCLFIEWGFEFFWKDTTWLEESLVSSGTSALYAVIASTIIRTLHFRFKNEVSCQNQEQRGEGTQRTEEERRLIVKEKSNKLDACMCSPNNDRIFCLKTVISQSSSGVISFGIGLLIDYFSQH